MIEGLVITLIGMAVVFVSLAILMFMIMGIERAFRSGEPAVEEVVVGERRKPGDKAEVAAMALALSFYLKEQGKELRRQPIAIDGVQYQVEMGGLCRSPVAVVVNEESYWASAGGKGLPVASRIGLMLGAQMRGTQYSRRWRSAYPMAQGGYWDRWGWGGRGGWA